MIAVVDGEALPPPQKKRVSTARTADFVSDFLPFALVAAFVVGGILRALLGRFLGASLTAGVTGLAAFLLFGALSTALVSGIIVFVIVLLFGSGRGWSSGQGWSSGGGPPAVAVAAEILTAAARQETGDEPETHLASHSDERDSGEALLHGSGTQ
jgi:uncharacterized membrane protein YgcG